MFKLNSCVAVEVISIWYLQLIKISNAQYLPLLAGHAYLNPQYEKLLYFVVALC
jgi:hypothetical protein